MFNATRYLSEEIALYIRNKIVPRIINNSSLNAILNLSSYLQVVGKLQLHIFDNGVK